MKPSAPRKITWIIGLLLGVLGIIGQYLVKDIQYISEHSVLLIMLGFVALAVGTTFKDA